MRIQSFTIRGLFGDRDVSLHFDENPLVIVGPNGLGKSSVASIFYLTISRQWQRLLEFQFGAISISIDNQDLSLKRDEISGLAAFRENISRNASSNIRSYVSRLSESDLIDEFISDETMTSSKRRRYAEALGMPAAEIPAFRRWLLRRMSPDNDLFAAPRLALEARLSEAISSRILYLPTYRRIEKDVKDVFPGMEDRMRRLVDSDRPIEAGRSGEYFTEFVNFGMEDVKKKVDEATQEIRDYSFLQYNNLSASYLRDVIRSKADKFSARSIDSLNEESITNILARVSEEALSSEDKDMLRHRIKKIQNLNKSDLEVEDKYLAHYFSRLVTITGEIGRREERISSFIGVCNKYLNPGKSLEYDEIGFSLKVINEFGSLIDFRQLSSGEKQIVSLFSHLYLDKKSNDIIVIDEPELSLSVPWQREFLPDIIASDETCFVLAVTHSPFIYDNVLRKRAVDLRRLTTKPGIA